MSSERRRFSIFWKLKSDSRLLAPLPSGVLSEVIWGDGYCGKWLVADAVRLVCVTSFLDGAVLAVQYMFATALLSSKTASFKNLFSSLREVMISSLLCSFVFDKPKS